MRRQAAVHIIYVQHMCFGCVLNENRVPRVQRGEQEWGLAMRAMGIWLVFSSFDLRPIGHARRMIESQRARNCLDSL